MPREYRHMQEYEREIIELYEKGLTLRKIGKKFGYTYKQMHEFKTGYNRKQKKLAAGIALKRKGRGEYIHFYNHQRIQLKTKLTPLEKRSQFVD